MNRTGPVGGRLCTNLVLAEEAVDGSRQLKMKLLVAERSFVAEEAGSSGSSSCGWLLICSGRNQTVCPDFHRYRPVCTGHRYVPVRWLTVHMVGMKFQTLLKIV